MSPLIHYWCRRHSYASWDGHCHCYAIAYGHYATAICRFRWWISIRLRWLHRWRWWRYWCRRYSRNGCQRRLTFRRRRFATDIDAAADYAVAFRCHIRDYYHFSHWLPHYALIITHYTLMTLLSLLLLIDAIFHYLLLMSFAIILLTIFITPDTTLLRHFRWCHIRHRRDIYADDRCWDEADTMMDTATLIYLFIMLFIIAWYCTLFIYWYYIYLSFIFCRHWYCCLFRHYSPLFSLLRFLLIFIVIFSFIAFAISITPYFLRHYWFIDTLFSFWYYCWFRWLSFSSSLFRCHYWHFIDISADIRSFRLFIFNMSDIVAIITPYAILPMTFADTIDYLMLIQTLLYWCWHYDIIRQHYCYIYYFRLTFTPFHIYIYDCRAFIADITPPYWLIADADADDANIIALAR